MFGQALDADDIYPFEKQKQNKGTGGPTVVTEGKDALLTCVIMGSFSNDTVLWRRGNNEILAAGTSRVTPDRRFRVLHDDSKFSTKRNHSERDFQMNCVFVL